MSYPVPVGTLKNWALADSLRYVAMDGRVYMSCDSYVCGRTILRIAINGNGLVRPTLQTHHDGR